MKGKKLKTITRFIYIIGYSFIFLLNKMKIKRKYKKVNKSEK